MADTFLLHELHKKPWCAFGRTGGIDLPDQTPTSTSAVRALIAAHHDLARALNAPTTPSNDSLLDWQERAADRFYQAKAALGRDLKRLE